MVEKKTVSRESQTAYWLRLSLVEGGGEAGKSRKILEFIFCKEKETKIVNTQFFPCDLGEINFKEKSGCAKS